MAIPTSPRRPARALPVLAAAAIVVTGAAATGCAAVAPVKAQTGRTTYTHAVDRLELDLDSGNIELTTGAAGQVDVRRKLTWTKDRPKISETWQGDTLRITSTCDGRRCSADFTVTVPSGVTVDASTQAGNIGTGAIHGAQRLTTLAGNISVGGAGGDLTVSARSGNVNATGLAGRNVSAVLGSGNLGLAFVDSPAAVTAHDTAGNIAITVPHGTAGYRVDADVPAGQKHVTVTSSTTAHDTIVARSDAGNVGIGYA